MKQTADEVARRFVDAVAWGEHHTVWELLGREGRTAVLRVATARGMDDGLAARLREGLASTSEVDAFLTDLVNGLRTDLAGADIDTLEFELAPGPEEPGRAHVLVTSPLPGTLAVAGLPVGFVELSEGDGTWRVERLVPRAQR